MSEQKLVDRLVLRTVYNQDDVNVSEVKEGIELTVRALTPGTYTGIDGHTITYLADVIDRDLVSLAGQQVKWFHAKNTLLVVGYVKGVATKDGVALAKLVITHPAAVVEIQKSLSKKESIGVSIEAVIAHNDKNETTSINAQAIALILAPRKPACNTCVTVGARMIQLEEQCECPLKKLESELTEKLGAEKFNELLGECEDAARERYPNETDDQIKKRCMDSMSETEDIPDSDNPDNLTRNESTVNSDSPLTTTNSGSGETNMEKNTENKNTIQGSSSKLEDIPPQVKQAMDQLGLERDQAYQAAAIFGFSAGRTSPSVMSNNLMAPLTQADAVTQIETELEKNRTAEATKVELADKLKESEAKLEETTTKLTELEASHKKATETIDEIHKVEMAQVEEQIKKLDPEGKFLATLEGVPHDQKLKVLTTLLQDIKISKDVSLQRGDAKGGQETTDAMTKEIFGETEEEMVNHYKPSEGGQ